MTTLFITHPIFLEHIPDCGHPERPERLLAILKKVEEAGFKGLKKEEAIKATREQVLRIHTPSHLSYLEKIVPTQGVAFIDGDTLVSPKSLEAAYYAAGAGVKAVQAIGKGKARNAFCAVRPPGHHAEPNRAMGFCLLNTIAIAAAEIQAAFGWKRIAIVDFDIHHGNGTQAAFWSDPDVMYASTHQWPYYPGTGGEEEKGAYDTIVNVPLPVGTDGQTYRKAVEEKLLPRLEAFRPEFLLISAGFDGHKNDPLASFALDESDYVWITEKLLEIADTFCDGRVVSVLEGGYDLSALASSVAAHVHTLMTYKSAYKG